MWGIGTGLVRCRNLITAADDVASRLCRSLDQVKDVLLQLLFTILIILPVHHALGAMMWCEKYLPRKRIGFADRKNPFDGRIAEIAQEHGLCRDVAVLERD